MAPRKALCRNLKPQSIVPRWHHHLQAQLVLTSSHILKLVYSDSNPQINHDCTGGTYMHVHNLFCMHMYMYRTEENWQCGPINVLSFAFADSIHLIPPTTGGG